MKFSNAFLTNLKLFVNSKSQNQFFLYFPKYNMNKFYNVIPKYIQEVNSVTKFKHNFKGFLIRKAYYNMKELLE